MSDALLKEIKDRMEKGIDSLKGEFNKIRGNRASVSLVDELRIDYYGTMTPLKQMAQLSTPEPRLITITPWDKSSLAIIEKALIQADLGVSPTNDGNVIRLNLPALTEERRKELVKVVKKMAEDARVSIRHARRDGNEDVKTKLKDKEIAEDEEKRLLKVIQDQTDEYTAKIDKLLEAKEKDIMEV